MMRLAAAELSILIACVGCSTPTRPPVEPDAPLAPACGAFTLGATGTSPPNTDVAHTDDHYNGTLAFGTRVYLAAWETATQGVHVGRFTPDGTPLDEPSIVVGQANQSYVAGPAVAWDGASAFLVSWQPMVGPTMVARIDEDGRMFGEPQPVAAAGAIGCAAGACLAVSATNAMLAVQRFDPTTLALAGAPIPMPDLPNEVGVAPQIRARPDGSFQLFAINHTLHVAADGTPIDTAWTRFGANTRGLGVAVAADATTLVANDEQTIAIARLDHASGAVTTLGTLPGTLSGTVDIAAVGASHVVVWDDDHATHVAAIEGGSVGAPIRIGPPLLIQPELSARVAVAAGPNGHAMLAWSAYDPNARSLRLRVRDVCAP